MRWTSLFSAMVVFFCLFSFFFSCKNTVSEIKLGAVGPLTGANATFGQSTKNGCELAVEEYNTHGGVLGKKIKLIFADDKGEPTEAATVWTKLIEQDKVVAIVGTTQSNCSMAGAPISQSNKIPMISPQSTNPKVTEVGDYIFRACFLDEFQGMVGAQFARNELQVKKAGVIFDIGNDYTKGLSEFFKSHYEQRGGQAVAYEGHPTGITDFKAALTKILTKNPELIYIADYYNDVALIARQARELGFKGPLLGGDGWDSPKLTEIGGKDMENSFFTNHFSPDDAKPIVQDFVRRYQNKFSIAPDALAVLAYDATLIMLNAIKSAGSTDGEKIREALKNTNCAVVSGTVTFDEHRNPVKSAVIQEVKNGKVVYRATVHPQQS